MSLQGNICKGTRRTDRRGRMKKLFSALKAFLFRLPMLFIIPNFAALAEDLPHKSEPFLLQKGYTLKTDLEAGGNLKKIYSYSFYLKFMLSSDDENNKKQRALLGSAESKNGSTYQDELGSFHYNRTGIAIPVKLIVKRRSDSGIIYSNEFQKLWTLSSSNTYDKLIDKVTLEPGIYTVVLESLDDINQLRDLTVSFEIGLPGKH